MRNRFASRAIILLHLLVAVVLQRPAIAYRQGALVSAETLAGLESAVNRRDVAALNQLTVDGAVNDYEWASAPPGIIGARRPWQAKLLTLPGVAPSEKATFVAFTRYHNAESTADHLYRIRVTEQGARLGAEIPETDLLGVRVRHHQLAVRFDIPAKHATLTDHVTIERLSTDFPSLVLRINAIYTVTAVKRGGVSTPYRQAGGFLAIEPPSPDNRRIELDLAYNGRIDVSTEDYIKSNQAALTGYWYPHTGRMPASSDVRITVPRGWAAIGQGEPAGKTVTATTSTYSWSNRMPICYITVAAGKYTVTSRKVGNVLVSAYVLLRKSGGPKRAEEAIEAAGAAITWFSRNFSPFPYTRYAVVETDVFPAALECYSFTLAAGNLIPLAIVHEVAHTWWGGVIPNTYTRSLWNESFAEYSDGLYGRRTGRTGLHEFNTKMMSQSGFITKHNLLNAKDAMDMEQSMLGYGKGSLVLENLERMLGTEKMLASMRRFIADHRKNRTGEDSDWPDFVDAVAQTAGEEWRGFFPPWLTGTNLPALRLRDVTSAQEGGKYVLTGIIAQSEPAHWLKLPLSIQAADGTSVKRDVSVRSPSQPFRIELDRKPAQVALDPQSETLRASAQKGVTANLLSFQTISAPLLVVYATGGGSRETAIAKEVAEQQAREVFPFATVTVKADTEVTEGSLTGSNVLLIGRAESLRIPEILRPALPFRIADGKIALGARQWVGEDVWGLAVMSNPLNSRRLLGHAAAANPAALRNFHHQADLDTFKATFIVRGAGKPVVSEEARSMDSTVVILNP